MSKQRIKQLIQDMITEDGLIDLAVNGVQIFRVTVPLPCIPAVYEPSVVAIVSGAKEAILDGVRYEYDSSRYLCCSLPMPVEAGTPTASMDSPLLGIRIFLNTKVMTGLAIEMEQFSRTSYGSRGGPLPQGFALASWDDSFTEALLRLLQLEAEDAAVLGEGRLREVYYTVLKGEAGDSVRRAFGVGNEVARAIEYLSSHLGEPITIEDMAAQVGMSRAVFHRKFKQVTTMSPIQFVKSMRLNSAAMKMAAGLNVNEAAMEVGYASSSQFSREFKRMYGLSPKQWVQSQQPITE